MKHLYLALCVSLLTLTACSKPAETTADDTQKTDAQHVEEDHSHHETAEASADADSHEHEHHEHEHHEHEHHDSADVAKKMENMEAEVIQQGDFTITTPFAKAPIPGQQNSSVYFTITNNGSEAVTATGVSSDVSAITEFHTMEMDGGKMVMRPMDEVKIPAGGDLKLSLGANHIMLIDLQKTLAEGDVVNLKINLSNGETLDIAAKVQNI